MKKPLIAVVLLVFNLCPVIATRAKSVVTPMQVKQILVHSAVGGLLNCTSADIKVVAEAGEWHSYLDLTPNNLFRPGRKVYHGSAYKFIGVVNPALVDRLLTGIAFTKPDMTPSTFGITAQGLISDLKSGAKLPITDAPDFEKLITAKTVDTAIAKLMVGLTVMDAFSYCEVDVITRRNDTIKLSTRNLCPTQLPWTINKKHTYDMAINNFVVAAMGNADLPDKEYLSINALKASIYGYINQHNQGEPIASFKWKYYYPLSLKAVTTHFTITAKKLLYTNVYSCSLRTSAMPANASLTAGIDMANEQDTKALIKYAALIDSYFKTKNFMFNYYSKGSNGNISFSYYTGHSPYPSLRDFARRLPVLAKIDSTQVISLWAGGADDNSQWMMFPDGKILLFYHLVTTPYGKSAPIYPLQDPRIDWGVRSHTYYLFDRSGKVLNQGIGS